MTGVMLIYLLCFVTGFRLVRATAFNSLFSRALLVFTVGAAQLMVSVEVLSLCRKLTGWWLLPANLLLTLLAVATTQKWTPPSHQKPWASLARSVVAELKPLRRRPLALGAGFLALLYFVSATLLGAALVPLDDSYHYEMPLFWVQNASVLPFPVHNPRITSLSFLGEVLGFPFFLYARSATSPVVVTFLAGLLALGAIFALARRIGASVEASFCASAITTGYTLFGLGGASSIAAGYLAAAWIGGSLVFLMDARDPGLDEKERNTLLGCSVVSFLMACGAKNTSILLGPAYAVALLLTLAFAPAEGNETKTLGPLARTWIGRIFAVTRSSLPMLVVCGVAGLVSSGVLWNYCSNKIWFGNSRGPEGISSTLAYDCHPRAVWTRLCRGATLLVYDTIYIPGSLEGNYARLCEKTVALLGGQKELAEDDEYYHFKGKALTPRKGLGLLGTLVFLPALGLTAIGGASGRLFGRILSNRARLNIFFLILFSITSFAVCHVMLRWQWIGLLRLMTPFVVAGAPLCALLLEYRLVRAVCLPVLAISQVMLLTLLLGMVARRLDWSTEQGLTKYIAQLQKPHAQRLECQWAGKSPRELLVREDYSKREISKTLLAGLRHPCRIGVVAHKDIECTWLFGAHFENTLVPLIDARAPDKIMEPIWKLDYIVAFDKFSEARVWAERHGFRELLKITDKNEYVLLAFGN